MAADRYGLSFYSYDAICNLLKLSLDQYIQARNGLMEKDMIAFDGILFQVLELQANPPQANANQSVEPSPLVALAAKMFKEL